jgi:cell fate (sporulation/competence/biofilm development) regulator YlbF (YheA/YmcA/DUF963 family)
MERILDMARSLGREIGQHERFARFRKAEHAVESDEAARGLRQSLETQAEKIARLEYTQQPVEPQDKRKLMELRNQAHANPLLQELARAEADYMELMNKVNRAMLQELYPSEKT